MPAPLTPTEIAALIGRRDSAFKSIIREVGPPPAPRSAPVNLRYAALVRCVTYQLLATRAASSIHGRVQELCEGAVSVDTILAAGPQRLRAAGLSQVKARAMIELAESVQQGRIRITDHGRMSEDNILREVTTVHGIGPWTVQMYLMNTLARRDVWPIGDFGVRNGWTIAHGLSEMIDQPTLRAAGARFDGVRSAVAWYCWQAAREGRPTK